MKLTQDLPERPQDPIYAVAAKAKAAGPNAIDGSVGVYKNDEGLTHFFDVTRKAFRLLPEDFAYSPSLSGIPGYRTAVQKLLGLENTPFASIATAGGTPAIRLCVEAVKQVRTQVKHTFVLPVLSWSNHHNIIRAAGMDLVEAPYLLHGEPNVEGIMDVIRSIRGPCTILDQLNGQNPTGLRRSTDQWHALADFAQDRGVSVLMDAAYQGFSDEPEKDVEPLHILRKHHVDTLVAWSASKNHTSYGYRTGLAGALTETEAEEHTWSAMFQSLGRELSSSAPTPGQRIVEIVQNQFPNEWRTELRTARQVVDGRRLAIAEGVEHEYIRKALIGDGLFAALPFSPEKIEFLAREELLFLTDQGRINIAGIQNRQVPAVIRKLSRKELAI